MINEISRILEQFRPCFSRRAAFEWFVIVIFGFMIRLDHYGVSSFVRWLCIDPQLYTSLLWFFRASSWELRNVNVTISPFRGFGTVGVIDFGKKKITRYNKQA